VVFGGRWKAPKNGEFNPKTETDFDQKQTELTERRFGLEIFAAKKRKRRKHL
jgi:hypothetical protein